MFKLNSKKLLFPIAAVISIAVMVFFISYSLSQESYAVSAFTEVGEHTWIVPEGVTSVDVLVVGGGGGGAGRYGGGGGAGGVVYVESYSVSPSQIINITVGDGGNGAPGTGGVGSNGQNSVFGTLTAIGGGGGGGNFNIPGNSGGSGGGSSGSGVGALATQPGSTSGGYGNNGGNGLATYWNNGGGGGAGEIGENGTATKVGDGGDGLYYGDIFGNQYGEDGWFGGGGGGGSHNPAPNVWALGGLGGGGDGGNDLHTLPSGYIGDNGDNGMSGTGGGAGAGSTDSGTGGAGGKGGSGIVLIKYRVKLGTAQSAPAYKGLVGHWSMDAIDYNNANNRLTDKSSFENHGINSGATFTTDRFGKEGGAMSFDGSANYINAGNSNIFNSNSRTLSVWIKTSSTLTGNSSGTIIAKVQDASPYNGFVLNVNRTVAGKIYYYAGGWYNTISSAYNDNNWHHVVVVHNGSNLIFYVDGVEDGNYSVPAPTNYDADLLIGKERDGAPRLFNGSIDEPRIYNRALSESEIQSLYNSYNSKTTTGTLQKGLVLDMPLKLKYTKDETSGSEIMTDRTPYSNDGQNYGATITNDGVSFDGVSNFIQIGESDILDITKSITISFWYQIPELNTTQRLITKKIGGGTFGLGYETSFYNSNRFLTTYNNGNNRIYLYSGYINNPSDVGKYFHYTYVYNYEEGYQKAFINGEDFSGVGSFAAGYEAGSTAGAVLDIGRRDSEEAKGVLSNVLIYNRALSDEEIKMLHDRGRSDAGIMFTPDN